MEKAKQGIQLRGRRFIRKLQWHVAKRGSDSRSAIAALFQDPSELLEGAGIGVQPRFQSFHYHSSLLSLLAKWHSLSNNGKKRTRWKRRWEDSPNGKDAIFCRSQNLVKMKGGRGSSQPPRCFLSG